MKYSNFESDNFFLTFIKESTQTTQLDCDMLYKLLMHFFPSDRKVTNQILVSKKKTWKDFQLLWDF